MKNPTTLMLTIVASAIAAGCVQSPPAPAQVPAGSPMVQTVSAEPQPTNTLVPPTATAAPTTTPDFNRLPTHVPVSTLQPGQPVIILSIDMKTVTEGFAVAAPSGWILYTKDGGSTWKEITPPDPIVVTEPVTAAVATEFHGLFGSWVYYLGGDQVWGSFDRGLTWRAGDIDGYPSTFAARLTFADDDHGWLLQSVESGMGSELVALFRTTNRGATWQEIVNPYEDDYLQSCLKTGISFSSPRIGWVTYDCQGNYAEAFLDVSRDGGMTWQARTLPPPENKWPELEEGYCTSRDPEPLQGVLIVECRTIDGNLERVNSFLYRTSDEGRTWEILPFPGGELFFTGQNELVSASREIHRSVDGGLSWTKIKTVSWDGQFDIHSGGRGWAVARRGDEIAFVLSEDGGGTWEEIKPQVGED